MPTKPIAYQQIDWELPTANQDKKITTNSPLWDFHQELESRIKEKNLENDPQGLWTLAIVKSIVEVKLNRDFMVGAIKAFETDLANGVYQVRAGSNATQTLYDRKKPGGEFIEYKKASKQYDEEKGDMLRTSKVRIGVKPQKEFERLANDLLTTFKDKKGLDGFIYMYESFMDDFKKLGKNDQNECLDEFINNIAYKNPTGCVNDRSGNALTAMQMKMLSKSTKQITHDDFLKQIQDIYNLYCNTDPLDLAKVQKIDQKFKDLLQKFDGYQYIDPANSSPPWIINASTGDKLKEIVLNFITMEDEDEKKEVLGFWSKLGVQTKTASTTAASSGAAEADVDIAVSTPGTGVPSRSKVLNKKSLCFSPPRDQWHEAASDSQVLIVGKDKTFDDAKLLLLTEISQPPAKQVIANILTAEQSEVLDTYKKGEIRAIKYTAPLMAGPSGDLVAGSTLLQCGVVATCIEPGKKMGLDLVLPPDLSLKQSTLTEKDANFNTLVFAHVHKAVQAQVEALRNSGGTGNPIINLNRVTDPDTHKFTVTQLAMIQYCHFKGYPCLSKDGQKLGEKILNDHSMETKKTSDFHKAFEEFTKVVPVDKKDQEAKAEEEEDKTQEQGMKI